MTSTNKKLEEVDLDFWGPHDLASLSRSVYTAILICLKTRKTWVLYFYSKDEFVDIFQVWLPKVENESNCTMKALYVDDERKFISIKLKTFSEKKGITFKYAAPYMHKENGLAERGWQIIIIIKDLLLLDSRLPIDFWAEAMDTANYF